ncbi:MAG TPA: Na/Pi cotransporter family protein [Methanomassiliicoccales archaeon]|nr:Na/Pi cotransporter family protein [Methanomassiliicoccales archaeon]
MAAISWELLFAIVPGLILFLYGIENFSKEIINSVGERFRETLGKLTKDRWRGAAFGALLTGTVQSSAATTVIAVSLVNAGTISFAASLGVIVGANIGTTLTAQLVAFKLTSFGPLFILIGFVWGLIGGRYKFIGKPLFYFGLVFFGLELVSNSLDPIREDPAILSLISNLDNFFIALLVGVVFTTAVQSSSVTSGLMVVLASSGLLTLEQAIPVLLGANIGSTTTTLFASAKMDLWARRAAIAHLLFNVAGVLIFIPLAGLLATVVTDLTPDVGQQVANAHLIFNVITAIVFLVLLKQFEKVVVRVVPGDEKEVLFRPRFLTKEMPEDNGQAFHLIEQELGHGLEVTKDLLDASFSSLSVKDKRAKQKVTKLESLNDYLDDEIADAILRMSRRSLKGDEGLRTTLLVRMSNLMERLGDHAEDIGDLATGFREKGRAVPKEQLDQLSVVFEKLRGNLELLGEDVLQVNEGTKATIRNETLSMSARINDIYSEHLERMRDASVPSDSTLLELLTIMESANEKVRELAALASDYAKLAPRTVDR